MTFGLDGVQLIRWRKLRWRAPAWFARLGWHARLSGVARLQLGDIRAGSVAATDGALSDRVTACGLWRGKPAWVGHGFG